ncbi:MAG: glycosyltransferase [Thermoleophilia bacterium]|nr:glycosyltransferase [Thermoleophilia bacterium]
MRILQVHNHHVLPGGMEVLHQTLVRELMARGHEVSVLERHNAGIATLADKLSAFLSGFHSVGSRREAADLLARARPDVVHAHNLFPLLSPSVLDACVAAGVPVVLSVQDYKLTCPVALHHRDGGPCEQCLGGNEHRCVVNNCRGSVAMSTAYAAHAAATRVLGRFPRAVSLYVAPSAFVRDLHVRAGFPAERMRIVPNPSSVTPSAAPPPAGGGYVAYLGRLAPEKGIRTLLAAARLFGGPVRVAGDPSKMPGIESEAPPNVEFLGPLNRDAAGAFLRAARFLVVPSEWYEAFGIVAAEAMSLGLPVVASRLGGLPEVVEDGVSGLLFEPGNAQDLASKMRRLWHDRGLVARLGEAARIRAAAEYGVDTFCDCFIHLYAEAMDLHKQAHLHEPAHRPSAAPAPVQAEVRLASPGPRPRP